MIWQNYLYVEECASDLAELPALSASDLAELLVPLILAELPVPVIWQNCLYVDSVPVIWQNCLCQ